MRKLKKPQCKKVVDFFKAYDSEIILQTGCGSCTQHTGCFGCTSVNSGCYNCKG